MDKKKVKELIQKAKHLAILRKYENRQTYLNNCICCLEDALKELSKSDWVSVEDGLPRYGEKVFAYDKEMQDYPFVTMRYKAGKEKLIDKNGFRSGLHVTHWKPIEKLEE